jgi:hypothetical protein
VLPALVVFRRSGNDLRRPLRWREFSVRRTRAPVRSKSRTARKFIGELNLRCTETARRRRSISRSRLTADPLDSGFDSFFGLTKAPSGPPYFYIRGRELVAKPTETTPGTKRDLKTASKDSRTAYVGGDFAPGFVPEECNSRLSDDVVF